MSKARVVTLGETMVLFQTMQDGSIKYAPMLGKTLGGAESNVAIGLSRLGVPARWISKLGTDPFGDYILSTLKGEDVEVEAIRDQQNPTGLMFKEVKGESDPNVYYYRKASAASIWNHNDLNTDFFQGCELFHFTGITPALSETSKEMIFRAVDMAKASGLTISFDPNMRYKLWSEEEARTTFLELVKRSDIVLPGVEEGELITGKSHPDEIAADLINMGVGIVVLKQGPEGSSLYHKKANGEIEKVFQAGFPVNRVIDSVGAGDGFAAGFLSGFLEHLSYQECLERANAVGAMVTQYRGDWEGLPSIEEVKGFITGKSDITR